MIYKVKSVIDKSADWKVITLENGASELKDVSVNRTNKKGEVFPNFDAIVAGSEVEGEFWQSDAGKNYLFAPKPQKANGGAFKQKQINDTMATKAEHIAHAQDEKQHGIKVSSTFRAAVDCAVAEWQEQKRTSPMTAQPLDKLFEKWREYYWLRFDVQDTDYPPMA